MPLNPRSVRTKLTLWYTLVLSVPLAAFAIVSYAVFSRSLHSSTDAFISDALSVFGREVVSERRVTPTASDAIRLTLAEVRFQDLDILVLDDRGTLLAMSAPRRDNSHALDRPRDSAAVIGVLAAGGAAPWSTTLERPTNSYRVHTRQHVVGGRQVTLAGVYPLHEVNATLARIREMFLIAIPLLIACAATGGWFLAKRNLEPLEQSYEQQRRFMADASHELRTPAAVLRAEADVTLSRPQRSEAEYRESMSVVQGAARRLTRIVDDIFLLARADAGHLVMHPGVVDLDDVVLDAVRAVQAIGTARNVRVELRDVIDSQLTGDADLLGRVMLNLLDNAVKNAPDASAVDVRMAARNGAIEVSVVDGGAGIPADAQERVFERFYRVDSARSRAESSSTSGAGLGLPIARRISEMHGGTVELVESRPGRTEFRVRLPLNGASTG